MPDRWYVKRTLSQLLPSRQRIQLSIRQYVINSVYAVRKLIAGFLIVSIASAMIGCGSGDAEPEKANQADQTTASKDITNRPDDGIVGR